MPNSWSLNWEALQRGRGVTGKMSDHSIYLRVSGVYVPVAIITSPGLFVAFPLCLELLCCFTESFLTFLLGYLLPPRLPVLPDLKHTTVLNYKKTYYTRFL